MGLNYVTSSKRTEAMRMRLAGKSYGEIKRGLGISSKGTLSSWFRHLKLPPEAQKRLEKNRQLANERGLLKFNRERSKRIAQEDRDAFEEGRGMVGTLSKREQTLIGAALYWGEGTKYHARSNGAYLSFSNSDPMMIEVFMRFIREILQIREERIRGGIHLYPGTHIQKAREYWSGVTGLPTDRFYISKQISRSSQRKKKWNKLPHGTLAIRISNRTLFHHTMGLIRGIAESN